MANLVGSFVQLKNRKYIAFVLAYFFVILYASLGDVIKF